MNKIAGGIIIALCLIGYIGTDTLIDSTYKKSKNEYVQYFKKNAPRVFNYIVEHQHLIDSKNELKRAISTAFLFFFFLGMFLYYDDKLKKIGKRIGKIEEKTTDKLNDINKSE